MATRVLLPREQVFSNIGIVGAGYRLFFYETGTTTKKDTYSDEDLTIPNTNPVVADSAGRFGDIWISDSSLYKCVLAPAGTDDPPTNPIWTADPVNLNNSGIITIDPLPTAYWGATTGTSSSYLLDIPDLLVPIESYSNKQTFFVDFHIACAANPIININNLGSINLKKYTGKGTKVSVVEGDIQTQRSLCIIDGVDCVILNPKSTPLYTGIAPTITIASNALAITNTGSNYLINTASGAQTINTITGGSDGEVIILQISSNSNAATITIADNIKTATVQSVVLTTTLDKIAFQYRSSDAAWVELFRSTGAMPYFQSEPQTITLNSTLTLPHPLPGIPNFYQAYLVCTDAGGEAGYTQNQETKWEGVIGDGNAVGLIPDATNITVLMQANAPGVVNASTYVRTAITPSKWRLIIRAFILR